MHNSSMIKVKQQFLKKWLVGLHACTSSKQNMNISERKSAVKTAANLAMASARNGTTRWSRAIISESANNDVGRVLIKSVLDPPSLERLKKKQHPSATLEGRRRKKKKKMLKKINGRIYQRARKNRVVRSKTLASSIAKRMIRKRAEVLRNLVPGGEFMEDEVSLIEETLDYISFLRAQVDVMRCVVNHNSDQLSL